MATFVRDKYEVDHDNPTGKEVREKINELMSTDKEESGGRPFNFPCDKTIQKLAKKIDANPNRIGMVFIYITVLIISNFNNLSSTTQV